MNCKTCGHKVTKLKVGDRVEVIKKIYRVDFVDFTGEKGVVIQIDGGSPPVLVEFDKSFRSGHDGNGLCKNGHGWRGEYTDFKVIKTKRRKIVLDRI